MENRERSRSSLERLRDDEQVDAVLSIYVERHDRVWDTYDVIDLVSDAAEVHRLVVLGNRFERGDPFWTEEPAAPRVRALNILNPGLLELSMAFSAAAGAASLLAWRAEQIAEAIPAMAEKWHRGWAQAAEARMERALANEEERSLKELMGQQRAATRRMDREVAEATPAIERIRSARYRRVTVRREEDTNEGDGVLG